jgi:hypothetical protein
MEQQSLFDFLGRAAGPELGWSVAKYASREKVIPTTRQVVTKTYVGNVNVYPAIFLEKYFADPNHKQVLAQDVEWYSKRNKK